VFERIDVDIEPVKHSKPLNERFWLRQPSKRINLKDSRRQ
jgi:hypothetical protein